MEGIRADFFPLREPFLLWNDEKTPYYLLILAAGNHNLAMESLSPRGRFIYLRRFLLPRETPVLLLSEDIVAGAISAGKQGVSPALRREFWELLLQFDSPRVLSFVEGTTL